MLASIWILPGILILSTVQGFLFGPSFQQRAIDTFNLVEEKLHVEKCTKSAQEKAATLTKKTTGDEYYATAWIMMTTQECKINEKLLTQNKYLNDFTMRMNKEVRCLRNKKRDSSLSDIFVKVRNIIDESLDIMGTKYYQNLFSGIVILNFTSQTHFIDEGFSISTSNINYALFTLVKGNILLIFQQMQGINVNIIDVLGRSGRTYKIEQKVTDGNEIKKIIWKLEPGWITQLQLHVNLPKMIIYVTEDTFGQNRQSVIEEQWPTMTSYCSEQYEASTDPGVLAKGIFYITLYIIPLILKLIVKSIQKLIDFTFTICKFFVVVWFFIICITTCIYLVESDRLQRSFSTL